MSGLSDEDRELVKTWAPWTLYDDSLHDELDLAALLNAARAEARRSPPTASPRPAGAGWSTPPAEEASHPERLSSEDLALAGTALSEWAWDHLSKGYGVALTVREVSRLIAGVRASCAPLPEQAPTVSGEPILGWFSALARKHGYHDQADWLDEYRGDLHLALAPTPDKAEG